MTFPQATILIGAERKNVRLKKLEVGPGPVGFGNTSDTLFKVRPLADRYKSSFILIHGLWNKYCDGLIRPSKWSNFILLKELGFPGPILIGANKIWEASESGVFCRNWSPSRDTKPRFLSVQKAEFLAPALSSRATREDVPQGGLLSLIPNWWVSLKKNQPMDSCSKTLEFCSSTSF